MPALYPPPGFHFALQVIGLPPADGDLRFTEVGGLSMELQTEEVAQGGENRHVQRYPVRAKYPDLVCKRGLMLRSAIWFWVRECVEDLNITPRDIAVSLLDAEHQPLMAWHVRGAWPIKWSVSDLNANANAYVVETLTFAYRSFSLISRGA